MLLLLFTLNQWSLVVCTCTLYLLKCLKMRVGNNNFNYQRVSNVYSVIINSTTLSSEILWLLLLELMLNFQVI